MIVPHETGKALPKCKDCKYYDPYRHSDEVHCLHALEYYVDLVSGERKPSLFTECSNYRNGNCGLEANFFEAKLPDPQPPKKLTFRERCSRFIRGWDNK